MLQQSRVQKPRHRLAHVYIRASQPGHWNWHRPMYPLPSARSPQGQITALGVWATRSPRPQNCQLNSTSSLAREISHRLQDTRAGTVPLIPFSSNMVMNITFQESYSDLIRLYNLNCLEWSRGVVWWRVGILRECRFVSFCCWESWSPSKTKSCCVIFHVLVWFAVLFIPIWTMYYRGQQNNA